MRLVGDFPAPLGPRKPSTPPFPTSKEKSSTAFFWPNELVRFCTLIIDPSCFAANLVAAPYFSSHGRSPVFFRARAFARAKDRGQHAKFRQAPERYSSSKRVLKAPDNLPPSPHRRSMKPARIHGEW